MKQVTAILLLAILMFNWFGYRLLVSYAEAITGSHFEARLDSHQYLESELVAVKFPVSHLSYYSNSPLFERVDGYLEIGSASYRYVKRRLYNDSLEFLCIADPYSTRLQKTKSNLLKISGALSISMHTKKANSHVETKMFSVEFNITNTPTTNASRDMIIAGTGPAEFFCSSPFIASPDRPPNFFWTTLKPDII